MLQNRGKRAIQDAQQELEKEVERGNINQGGYLNLCKRMKTVYDHHLSDRVDAVAAYLLHQLVHAPMTAKYVPRGPFRQIIETPSFLRILVERHQRANQGALLTEWVNDLMDGLFPFETMQDQDDGKEFQTDWFRAVINGILKARCGLLDALVYFLDQHDYYPCFVHRLGNGTLREAPEMLENDPRFLWWLLNPYTVDDFTYRQWEVEQLQGHAFEHRDTCDAKSDLKFIAALGLRGPLDLEAVATFRVDSDVSYAEAKKAVLETPYPGTPPDLPERPDFCGGKYPYPWDL